MQMKPAMVEEAKPLADALLKYWLGVRDFLRLAMSAKPISREQDQNFLTTKSAMSKVFSQLRNRIPEQVLGNSEQMQTVMKQALSVTHIRNLPTPDKRQLYRIWHSYYMELCRTAGALKFMNDEKYYPKLEDKAAVKRTGNIKADMEAAERGRRKGS